MNTVSQFGGILVSGPTTYDGKTYSYRSVWNCDEDADRFLDSFPEGMITSARDHIVGRLTLFFTVKRDVPYTYVDL